MFGILSSVERIIIAALLVALTLVFISSHNKDKKLNKANEKIEQYQSKLENAEIQKEYLTQSVEIAEQGNAKLLRERDSLAKINEKFNKEIGELNEQYVSAQQQITILRLSKDENIKAWANDCVPVNAIGLLKYARAANCHQDNSTNENKAHSATASTGQTLQSGS